MNPHARSILRTTLRYLVCLIAVGIVVRSLSWTELIEVLQRAQWRWLLAAGLVWAPVPFGLALRLKLLLAANNVHVTMRQAVAVTFAGNFASLVLPGQTGGDVIKALYLARFTPRRHEAATVVFFDRVLGLACVVLLAGVMFCLRWGDPAIAAWGRPVAILFVALLVPAVLYFSNWFRQLIGWEKLIDRLPLHEHIRRVDQAVLVYRHHRGCVVRCSVLTVLFQIVAIYSTYLSGRAVGMVEPSVLSSVHSYLLYVPLCWVAGALPISPQGLGVMEWAYTQLIHKASGYGTAEGATMLSLLTRLTSLAWALPGLGYNLRLGRGAVPEATPLPAPRNKLGRD